MSAPIYGLQKTTLLDYPGYVASTIFLGSCNFCCPYCHNSSLITPSSTEAPIAKEQLFHHLRKRRNILEGVCITGGEPTLYSRLPEFIEQIKQLGYLVKLDTNGTNPSMLQFLLRNQLIDYVAMDIKGSKDHYGLAAGRPNLTLSSIETSVELLKENHIPYEFRTTLVEELHSPEDMKQISEWLKGPSSYYLQNFKPSDGVPNKTFHPLSKKRLQEFLSIVKCNLPNAQIRGDI